MMVDINNLPSLDNTKPVFFDIETEALYVNTSLVQLRQDGKSYLIEINNETDEHKIKTYLANLYLVGYNLSYDLGTLNLSCKDFDDLYYAIKIAYPQIPKFSLDTVIEFFGFPLYEGLDKKTMQKKGFKRGSFTSEELRYAEDDVKACELLWKLPKVQAVIRNNLAYRLDKKSLEYSIIYQQNGLLVDQKGVQKELEKLIADIDYNYMVLNGLNPNSPAQCKKALGVEKTDKPTLTRLISEGNELAKTIFNQRRLLKKRTMLESYNFPKVYTKFNPYGAASGRFTASGGDLPDAINAQQITRELQYLFKQPTDDTVAIDLDYSTLELRLACAIFNEPVMYQQLKNGDDLHREMAKKLTGKAEITKEERTAAKGVNFGYVFGMSAKAFQEYSFTAFGVKFTYEEASDIRNKYFEMYPSFKKYHSKMWETYETAVVETALGRRIRPNLGTDAINIPVQGTGAETTKLAVHYFVQDNGTKVLQYIYNVVHDAIYIRVPKDEKEHWEDRLRVAMLKAWTEISKTEIFKFKDIPMEVD